MGLLRVLKSLDLDNDYLHSFYEFKKSIRDYRLEVTDYELDILFSAFSNEKNQVAYLDFFNELEGELNEERVKILEQVFKKIDTDNDGVINVFQSIIQIFDLYSNFCARNHPDVKNGRKNEEQILQELVDALEIHKSLIVLIINKGRNG